MDKVVTVLKWMVELRCSSSCGLFPPNATALFIAHFLVILRTSSSLFLHWIIVTQMFKYEVALIGEIRCLVVSGDTAAQL